MTNNAKVIVIQLVVWYDLSVVDSDKSKFKGTKKCKCTTIGRDYDLK